MADRLRRLLTSSGVDTHLWVCEGEPASLCGGNTDREKVQYVKIPSYVFYKFNFKTLVGTILRAPATLFLTLKYIRLHRIETVILLYPIGYAWPFVLLRWLKQIRLIASCHGNEILTFSDSSCLARWLFRTVLRQSDAITVPARHLPEHARDKTPGRLLPIWLIPNCVDVEFFVPRPDNFVKIDQPTVIHISSFTPRKRTLDIVTAFSLAKLPQNSRLIMVGDGPERAAAIKLTADLKITDHVQFVGTPEDIRPFLWQSDILVMASDEESGPLTLLEAMACAIPWITTPWGIAVMLRPGECGLTVPGRTPQALATAVETLLNNPERMRTMGDRCRHQVLEHFRESKYCERHLDLVEAVVRGNGHQAVDYSVSLAASHATNAPNPEAET